MRFVITLYEIPVNYKYSVDNATSSTLMHAIALPLVIFFRKILGQISVVGLRDTVLHIYLEKL